MPTSPGSLPAVKVWDFSDPTAVPDGIEILDQDVISLAEKPFAAKRVLVWLQKSTLLFHNVSHRIKTHTKVDPNLMAFLAIGRRARGTIDGLLMTPDLLIVVPPGAAADMVVEPGYASSTLLISPDDLQSHLKARGRGLEFHMPRRLGFIKTEGPGIRQLFDLGHKIARTANRRPAVFDDSERARIAAHTEILESVLSILDKGSNAKAPNETRDRTRTKYAKTVKVAEDYALANLDDRLYVSDLCQAACVSERTLQGAFQEILHMTPIGYLNRLRLHRARASLRRASASTATVSEIALEWGFWHFGEFSQAYKDCFQEMPSETLRSKPDPQ